MSKDHFEEDCEGCKPAILDAESGERIPDDHPIMQAINRVWETLSREDKESFHRVCCNNSRDDADLARIAYIQDQLQKALAN